jgi:hypothetical protein
LGALSSSLPIDDLRRRVREAESLLGVARGLAKGELHDPATCERARDRIVSILREIDSLFPGLNDPPPSLDPSELVAPSMRGRSGTPANGGAKEEEQEGGEGQSDVKTDDEGEEEEEWELDPKKLAAAIENDQLMSKIPEVDRDWFRRMARRTIEAEERFELCDRVRRAFDDLAQEMREGLDETSRQLALVLTLEQLKSKQRH